MKKFILSSIVLILSIFISNAQITITLENVPSPGTNFIKGSDEMPVGIDPGTTGPGQTWDFSSLVADENFGYNYMSPLATPFPGHFPEANLAIHTMDTSYSYLYSDPDIYEMQGAVIEAEGEEYVFDYEPDMLIMEFPFAYGSQFSQDYAFEYVYSSGEDSIRIKNSVTKTLEVDAFGTVILPVGSFPALRATTTQVTKDSTWAQVLGNWVLIATTISSTNSFEWYTDSPDVDIILVSLTYDEDWVTLESAEFFKDSFVGINEEPYAGNIDVYPNPASDLLFVESDLTDGTVQIVNLAGQTLLERSLNSHKESVDLIGISAGTFFCRILDNDRNVVFNQKVVVK